MATIWWLNLLICVNKGAHRQAIPFLLNFSKSQDYNSQLTINFLNRRCDIRIGQRFLGVCTVLVIELVPLHLDLCWPKVTCERSLFRAPVFQLQ